MPIITEYSIVGYKNSSEPILNCNESCPCPECKKGILQIRSHVRRHIRKEGTGEKEWFHIPVGLCDNEDCGAMRRLLPDFMVPNKHYEKEAIQDVLDEVITEESPVDYPSIQTMRRWIAWLAANAGRIEGLFRSVGYRILCFTEELLFSTGSLLAHLKHDTDEWFGITIRFIYNSGYRLMPQWADQPM